jgi:hypothetical protein
LGPVSVLLCTALVIVVGGKRSRRLFPVLLELGLKMEVMLYIFPALHRAPVSSTVIVEKSMRPGKCIYFAERGSGERKRGGFCHFLIT